MFLGRFAHAIPMLAIPGSLAAKKEGEAFRRDHAD
jgi:K+-transporting ATPase A subunit